jgi:adenylosuccinate synthase
MINVVIGGQYGSEGKGKFVSLLTRAMERANPQVVRVGGPNAGHTVRQGSKEWKFRQLPAAAPNPNATLYIAAGSVIDLELLRKEQVQMDLVDNPRLRIDNCAAVMDTLDLRVEESSMMATRLGSTQSGTGSAYSRKVMRRPDLSLAREINMLKPHLTRVNMALLDAHRKDYPIIVEGTQGHGLSLNASGNYPFVTSHETTATGALAEAGLPPHHVKVYMVFRTFPIRTGGNSGPLQREITWQDLQQLSGSETGLGEHTTVTKRLRRVGHFEWDNALDAVRINGVDAIVVHGVDYLNAADRGVKLWHHLTIESQRFLSDLEERLNVPVACAFTGPDDLDCINMAEEIV